ncbi:MAG TPA: metal-sensing transcriptional repressor [Patescibacteria group bacterium]|nr:metal-sensing transcriptional repressor [Patescibacteria group bacterium]
MFQTKTKKENILHRLKIVRGHMNKVILMVENDDYCIDTLFQIKAIGKALHEAERVILEQHLETCLVSQIQTGKSQKAIEEMKKVLTQL